MSEYLKGVPPMYPMPDDLYDIIISNEAYWRFDPETMSWVRVAEDDVKASVSKKGNP